MRVMCYGSVQHIAVVELYSFMKKLQYDIEDFESLENVEKLPHVQAVSGGRVSSMD